METTMDFAASFLRGFEKRSNAKEVFRNLKRRGKPRYMTESMLRSLPKAKLNDVSVSPSTGLLNYESKAEKKGL
jgi:ribonuclease I